MTYFLLFFVLYFLLLSFFSSKLFIPERQEKKELDAISMLVILRDEALQLPLFFEDLKALDYPSDSFEVWFWNDASTDASAALIDAFKRANPHFNIQVVHENKPIGKKKIIQKAVMLANFDWILLSDADIRFSDQRLKAFSKHLSDHVDFCIGEVHLVGESFFQKLQALEYATLMAVARATSNLNDPIMGSSANLVFRKTAFIQCRPYQNNANIPSGDDVFLINSLKKLRKGNGRFISGNDVLVRTEAHRSLKKSILQRMRWAGKNLSVGDWHYRAVSILTLLVNVLLIPFFISCLYRTEQLYVLLVAFLLKFTAEFLFYRRLRAPRGIGFVHFLTLSIFYPLYVTFVGLLSFVLRPRWK